MRPGGLLQLQAPGGAPRREVPVLGLLEQERVPHASLADVWTYTHPKTGDRLHSRQVDYTVCADYYKGDPNGGYRSFVFTDHLSAEELVVLRDTVERDVRKALNIPFNPGAPALRYEHSMGQGLPDFIHRIGRQVDLPEASVAAIPAQAAAG
jgi:hypothetical protein